MSNRERGSLERTPPRRERHFCYPRIYQFQSNFFSSNI
nr:MAG TPA: hypothetical protein [Crassvirales sp.]